MKKETKQNMVEYVACAVFGVLMAIFTMLAMTGLNAK